MDQHDLTVLNSVLQAIATVVAIIGGIVGTIFTLRKLAPAWHKHAARWFVAFSPFIFSTVGVAILYFWHQAVLSAVAFTIGFAFQTVMFARDSKPIDRESVIWFGLSCCAFMFSVTFVILADLINRTVSLVGMNTELIGKLIDTVGKLVH